MLDAETEATFLENFLEGYDENFPNYAYCNNFLSIFWGFKTEEELSIDLSNKIYCCNTLKIEQLSDRVKRLIFNIEDGASLLVLNEIFINEGLFSSTKNLTIEFRGEGKLLLWNISNEKIKTLDIKGLKKAWVKNIDLPFVNISASEVLIINHLSFSVDITNSTLCKIEGNIESNDIDLFCDFINSDANLNIKNDIKARGKNIEISENTLWQSSNGNINIESEKINVHGILNTISSQKEIVIIKNGEKINLTHPQYYTERLLSEESGKDYQINEEEYNECLNQEIYLELNKDNNIYFGKLNSTCIKGLTLININDTPPNKIIIECYDLEKIEGEIKYYNQNSNYKSKIEVTLHSQKDLNINNLNIVNIARLYIENAENSMYIKNSIITNQRENSKNKLNLIDALMYYGSYFFIYYTSISVLTHKALNSDYINIPPSVLFKTGFDVLKNSVIASHLFYGIKEEGYIDDSYALSIKHLIKLYLGMGSLGNIFFFIKNYNYENIGIIKEIINHITLLYLYTYSDARITKPKIKKEEFLKCRSNINLSSNYVFLDGENDFCNLTVKLKGSGNFLLNTSSTLKTDYLYIDNILGNTVELNGKLDSGTVKIISRNIEFDGIIKAFDTNLQSYNNIIFRKNAISSLIKLDLNSKDLNIYSNLSVAFIKNISLSGEIFIGKEGFLEILTSNYRDNNYLSKYYNNPTFTVKDFNNQGLIYASNLSINIMDKKQYGNIIAQHFIVNGEDMMDSFIENSSWYEKFIYVVKRSIEVSFSFVRKTLEGWV